MTFAIFAAAAMAGVVATAPAVTQPTQPAPPQTRAAVQPVSDDALEDRIEFLLESNKLLHKYDIDVDVVNGVVTLTGDVATAEQKAEAERIVRIDGVSRVDSRIEVDPDADKSIANRIARGITRAGEAASDAWITAKVKWFLVGEETTKGQAIDVDVKDRVVTLRGTVRTQAAKTRAGELAGYTDGVTRVVNELVVKGW
jgi:osmotically-inducible protein OsmY